MDDRNKFLNEQIQRFSGTGLEENNSLVDVLQEMASADKKEIRSRAKVILIHLLKIKIQSENKSNSWVSSIDNNRDDIEFILDESPSLKKFYKDEHIKKDWPKILRTVSKDTGIPINNLPKEPIFTVDDVMNLDYEKDF